jgi:hypothetical protein
VIVNGVKKYFFHGVGKSSNFSAEFLSTIPQGITTRWRSKIPTVIDLEHRQRLQAVQESRAEFAHEFDRFKVAGDDGGQTSVLSFLECQVQQSILERGVACFTRAEVIEDQEVGRAERFERGGFRQALIGVTATHIDGWKTKKAVGNCAPMN